MDQIEATSKTSTMVHSASLASGAQGGTSSAGGTASAGGETAATSSAVAAAVAPPPPGPKKPMNAFFLFCKRHRALVKEMYPNLENRYVGLFQK